MFIREDWTQYRLLDPLCRKAGIPREKLPAVVVKEICDNALDLTTDVRVGYLGDTGFFVEDAGGGIEGDPEEIANLFSISRPLTSSKLLRTPSRGRLGNGLRVAVGAVLATGGTLVVCTRGRRMELEPRDDGATFVRLVSPWEGNGTRIEITFGPALEIEGDILGLARRAIELAHGGPRYAGRTSVWWYDWDGFFELLQAAASRTVREVVASFDGWAEPKAGRGTRAYHGRLASSLSREEALELLRYLRQHSRKVKPKRLGFVGRELDLDAGYARTLATVVYRGAEKTSSQIPMVVEAWVGFAEEPDEAEVTIAVNRTPIVEDVWAAVRKNMLRVSGCGVEFDIPIGRGRTPVVRVNIETPYLRLTDDSKAPDLVVPAEHLIDAISRAVRAAKRANGRLFDARPRSMKDAILDAIPAGIEKASGEGRHRYSLRQLYYAVRPDLLEEFDRELDYGWFSQVVTEREANDGHDLPGVYRDARGTLYHPHTGEEIPLGTLNVERYTRPPWTFKRILYSEKEGLFPLLRDAHWPERFDCALLTSKGFASRAARDVLDLLGETDEELTFFAVHDADGYGTKIFEALQEGTRARAGRQVNVVNLGLEPAEAREMGLQVENITHKKGRVIPVAKYVPGADREWLQRRRVELNAMSTPQFIAWLEAKFESFGAAKLVPPRGVLRAELRDVVRTEIDERIKATILRESNHVARVDAAVAEIDAKVRTRAFGGALEGEVRTRLDEEPELSWRVPVSERARELADTAADERTRR